MNLALFGPRKIAPFQRIDAMLERFSAGFFFRLGEGLQQLLDSLPNKERAGLIEAIITVQIHLDFLYTNRYLARPMPPLKTSQSAGTNLHVDLAGC
jgi:hypothetical protein